MTTTETKVWGIHSEDDGLFLSHDCIAIGWFFMGDLSIIEPTRDAFRGKFLSSVDEPVKPGAVPVVVGMLYKFANEMEIGDYVVFPSKINSQINIGIIEGPYTYVPEYETNSIHCYPHQRKVKWLKHLPRTDFSQGALYEVGSALTLFQVKNYADEYLSALDKNFKPATAEEDDATVAATAENIEQATRDFILKELSRQLKGYDLEIFIADLLKAMDYRVTVSPKGGDSGIDIIAYKDELPPRILVQVKSTDGNVNESTIQSLRGAMREGDYGLFVTLSTYTKNAAKYLKNTPIIRGIDGNALVELILKYYDRIDPSSRKYVPLKKVYIPVPTEEQV
ncbi:MAG: restriction endonuclease [Eggerthellaceae bacterium]|nr:restriction endonuclease [Eggerthellaceae bacterium]